MHFYPYLLLIVRFCTPSFFLSDFAPHLLPIVFCSKSTLKEGKGSKRWGGCKITQKKEEGVQNPKIGKKIGGKSAIKHKKVHLTRKGAKRQGAKSLKKNKGCKIAQITKDRGKGAIKPN